ncbi:MAG: hypothetical protein AAGC79_09190 [Pseudomonadota bacterium]
MRYATLFLWVLVPLGIWLVIALWGTPHIALTWRFYDNGDRFNPRAERHYIDCTYYGYLGAITIPAERGSCPRIRFLKEAV